MSQVIVTTEDMAGDVRSETHWSASQRGIALLGRLALTPVEQRMSEDMQIRNFAENTQKAYLLQVSLFTRYFGQPPERLGPESIRTYRLHLTDKKLASSSILVATAALRFLYNVTLKRSWNAEEVFPAPKQDQKLPTVLSLREVRHFLISVRRRKARVVLTACYAAGLRVSEAIALKPTDIDVERKIVHVRRGKGHKDREVMLASELLKVLRAWYCFARPKDWLFPGMRHGTHIGREAINAACRLAVKESCIDKRITPHTLRHAFAVHSLDHCGTKLLALQRLLGHTFFSTTEKYTRLASSNICATPSPLDLPLFQGPIEPLAHVSGSEVDADEGAGNGQW